MMVRALTSLCIGGGQDVTVGTEFEAPAHLARYWVTTGHVELVDKSAVIPGSGLTTDVLYSQDGRAFHLDPKAARNN